MTDTIVDKDQPWWPLNHFMRGTKVLWSTHRYVGSMPCWICGKDLTLVIKRRASPDNLTLKGARYIWRPAKGCGYNPQPICGVAGCLAYAEFAQGMDRGYLVPLIPWSDNKAYAIYNPFDDPSPEGKKLRERNKLRVEDRLFGLDVNTLVMDSL